MKYEVYLVRHSKTKGNLEGRYIGSRTDEPLCEKGILLAQKKRSELFEKYVGIQEELGIFASPMVRCVETAKLLFAGKNINTIKELREIDFGDFENKNYYELDGDAAYQAWIDSDGTADYPNGEGLSSFMDRTMVGFWKVMDYIKKEDINRAVIVCHGGSIMAIMSTLCGGNYFDYQVKNMEGYRLLVDVEDENIIDLSYDCI